MPRKPTVHPDESVEDAIQLAPPPTGSQLRELRRIGYTGPSPSTEIQAALILRQRRALPPAVGQKRRKKAAPTP